MKLPAPQDIIRNLRVFYLHRQPANQSAGIELRMQPLEEKVALPGLVLLAVLAFAFALFLIVYALCMLLGALDTWTFKRRMIRAGRFLMRRDWGRIKSEGGTFIVESFTLGWGIVRLWWIPESLSEQHHRMCSSQTDRGEAKKNQSATEWDRWCWDHLVSDETGRAMLVGCWTFFSGWRVDRIRKQHPATDSVITWSAMVQLERGPESNLNQVMADGENE